MAIGSKKNLGVMAKYLAITAVTPVGQNPVTGLDLKEAVKWIRKNTKENQIDPDKIGGESIYKPKGVEDNNHLNRERTNVVAGFALQEIA